MDKTIHKCILDCIIRKILNVTYHAIRNTFRDYLVQLRIACPNNNPDQAIMYYKKYTKKKEKVKILVTNSLVRIQQNTIQIKLSEKKEKAKVKLKG